jgi:endonuclease/exonuclease/phosphatase family metal-dependent hydrolase
VAAGVTGLRVLTLNLYGMHGDWPARRTALQTGLRDLRPDVVAFQEAIKTAEHDTPGELLGPGYRVVHQTVGLIGDGNSIAIGSRWPVAAVHEVDLPPTPRTADFPASTLMAEIDAPIGRLLLVNHIPSWRSNLELERELQTVAAARRIEEIVAERPMHVVLAGDLDATPDASSIRFLRGLQSLGGTSVWYRDSWSAAHPDDPGYTFTTRNPLVMENTQMNVEPDRRIDYVFVRCDPDSGPTLDLVGCSLAFAEPVDGAWATDHFGVIADLAPFAT